METFKNISHEEKLNFLKGINKDFVYNPTPLPVVEIGNIKIYENLNSNVFWEGFSGELKKNVNAISGLCLWDCRWKVEFENPLKKNLSGKIKVLSLKKSREEAIELLKSGRKIKSFTIPRTFGKYHSVFLDWLKEKITQLQVKKLFFHIPVHEYHFFINEIEVAADLRFDEMHEYLDKDATLLMEDLNTFCSEKKIELEFINPIKDHAISDIFESYRWPYMNLPLNYPDEEFIAVEMLDEVKIVVNTVVKDGVFAMFGIKDYYYEKATDELNSITINK